MIAINMRFIVSHPLLVFEDCAHQRHSLGVFSKLNAGSQKSTSHHIYQYVMDFNLPASEGPDLRFSVAK
jgi:hypothetical protein